MPGWMIGVLALVIIGGVTAFILWRKKTKKVETAWHDDPSTRAFKLINSITPVASSLANVYFEPGTDRNSFSLASCDAGIEKAFEKGGCAGYPIDRPRHRISIVVFNSIPDSQGDPAFKVFIRPGNFYYNTEWDKEQGTGAEVDHYVLAAAQMVAVGEPYGDVIVVPHHSGNEAHLATVVEYEMEHVLLAYYDGTKFEETKNHGQGQGHPLIPDCPGGALGFASRPFTGLCGGAPDSVGR
jgi:hypothetical protein